MDKNTGNMNCCEVEAIVSFDERGQLVIPKDVRKKFGLKAGDKFALVSCYSEGDVKGPCCFTLLKTADMRTVVSQSLKPILGGVLGE